MFPGAVAFTVVEPEQGAALRVHVNVAPAATVVDGQLPLTAAEPFTKAATEPAESATFPELLR